MSAADEPLDVVATIQVRPGRGDAVVAIVGEHLAATRAEEGCLRYDVFRVRRDDDTLVVIERWASRAALRSHGEAEHFVAMSAALAPELAAPPAVRVLEPVAAFAPVVAPQVERADAREER